MDTEENMDIEETKVTERYSF